MWDYRRRVSDLYRLVRGLEPREGWELWRRERDVIFATHAQSPIPPADRSAFRRIPCFDYDPALRVTAAVESVEPRSISLPHSGDGVTRARSFGLARFALHSGDESLTMYWLEAYGGGVFVPFRDQTNGNETYGGGRYLLDTAKGADLGAKGEEIVFDFNFAFHPSCVHDPRWSCPLSPPENRLASPIRAGERLPV